MDLPIFVMNKPVYLGQAILDLSKIVMYEFHYDYMKRKYNNDKLTLCYMDTDSLIYSIETDDFYKGISDDVKDRFNMRGYNSSRPLPVGLNKKVIGLMKDELGGEIMTEFVTLRPKMYAYKTGSVESTARWDEGTPRSHEAKSRNAKESRNVWFKLR